MGENLALIVSKLPRSHRVVEKGGLSVGTCNRMSSPRLECD